MPDRNYGAVWSRSTGVTGGKTRKTGITGRGGHAIRELQEGEVDEPVPAGDRPARDCSRLPKEDEPARTVTLFSGGGEHSPLSAAQARGRKSLRKRMPP